MDEDAARVRKLLLQQAAIAGLAASPFARAIC